MSNAFVISRAAVAGCHEANDEAISRAASTPSGPWDHFVGALNSRSRSGLEDVPLSFFSLTFFSLLSLFSSFSFILLFCALEVGEVTTTVLLGA